MLGQERSASPQGTFQRGLSFAAWWAGQYQEPIADRSLEMLQATGANWISLIVTGYQETPSSLTIDYSSPSTPTDDDLRHVVAHAHTLGLKVMLKPHLDLCNERENNWWRGHIGTEFTTEEQWSAWFASYQAFIEHYAGLAQEINVEQFSVGTELLGTTHREADWRAVIDGVRNQYDGPLTYASLHSGEETSITWWDAVDYIGVDAYYPLTTKPDPTVAELKAGWTEPIATLAQLAAEYDKQIIITEIGYRSHDGANVHPWSSWYESSLDLQEQADAYQAAFEELYDQPWLAGMFWWTWMADRFESGPCDDGYSPLDKPAEDILVSFYGGAASNRPVLLPDYAHTEDVYTTTLAAQWQDWSWDAAVDLTADGGARSPTGAISVTLQPWGALSLWHSAFDTTAYQWLEFYVGAEAERPEHLAVSFDTEDGLRLPTAPVSDCRFLDQGSITPETWNRVRIPLGELNPWNDSITRINIQNEDGTASTTFRVDDLRLLGAKDPTAWVFLPLVLSGP